MVGKTSRGLRGLRGLGRETGVFLFSIRVIRVIRGQFSSRCAKLRTLGKPSRLLWGVWPGGQSQGQAGTPTALGAAYSTLLSASIVAGASMLQTREPIHR